MSLGKRRMHNAAYRGFHNVAKTEKFLITAIRNVPSIEAKLKNKKNGGGGIGRDRNHWFIYVAWNYHINQEFLMDPNLAKPARSL